MGDEILEVNGKSLEDATHTEVISHIHQVRDGPRSSPRTRPASCEMYSSEDFTFYDAQWGVPTVRLARPSDVIILTLYIMGRT